MKNENNQDVVKTRNSNVECMRVTLTFFVCLLHVISQGGYNVPWFANLFHWCVAGFVFISGWFGIRFSLSKLVALLCINIYCSFAFVTFDFFIGNWSGGVVDFLIYGLKESKGQWFFNAYIILMCFAPLCNIFCDEMSNRFKNGEVKLVLTSLIPVLVCIFGWSFATTLPFLNLIVPKSSGLTELSFLTLIGIYIVARLLHQNKQLMIKYVSFFSNKGLMVFFVGVVLFLASMGLSNLNSPIAVILAGLMFFLFSHIRMSLYWGLICKWLAPSMFSIYLLHVHRAGWQYIKVIEQYFVMELGLSVYLTFLLTALLIFTVCLVLDVPRRLFVFGWKNFIKGCRNG